MCASSIFTIQKYRDCYRYAYRSGKRIFFTQACGHRALGLSPEELACLGEAVRFDRFFGEKSTSTQTPQLGKPEASVLAFTQRVA